MKLRKTIWLNKPLEDLLVLLKKEGKEQGFSRALGEIVEKYLREVESKDNVIKLELSCEELTKLNQIAKEENKSIENLIKDILQKEVLLCGAENEKTQVERKV